jgi:Protein of unknown function (DUF1360)
VSVPLLALLVVLIALGTHRTTRFITRDKFPPMCVPRDAFVERWGVYADAKPGERQISISGKRTNIFMRSIAYAWECDWCTGFWVGMTLTYLTYRWTDTMVWVLAALAASSVTGLIAQREPD